MTRRLSRVPEGHLHRAFGLFGPVGYWQPGDLIIAPNRRVWHVTRIEPDGLALARKVGRAHDH